MSIDTDSAWVSYAARVSESAAVCKFPSAPVMPVIGVFMAVMEASGVANRRLRDPVSATGEFVKAECVTYERRGRVQWEAMHTVTMKLSATPNDRANTSRSA